MTTREVPVPELGTLSITVSIAPHVAGGLEVLVRKTLTRTTGRKRERTGDTIINRSSGTVHGTVIQIGKVHGNVNDDRGR